MKGTFARNIIYDAKMGIEFCRAYINRIYFENINCSMCPICSQGENWLQCEYLTFSMGRLK